MKNRMMFSLMFFLVAIIPSLMAVDFPINQLKLFADGLNIEGGSISHDYLKKGQVWSNLCVILDRPFENACIEWQELTNLNTFPLKEASILEYNETQVNFTYATLMHYYLTHAHQIVNKKPDLIAKVLIQVHRNTSGPSHIKLLENLLSECYPDLQKYKQLKSPGSKYESCSYFFPAINVELDFCYSSAPENLGKLGKYSEADIVLSFSLVAGFHPDWASGALLAPIKHLPFSLKELVLLPQKGYRGNNHLIDAIPDIIQSQNESILEIINHKFISLNPEKHHLIARKLQIKDFKEATLLQVDGVFNPSELPSTFSYLENNE